MKLLGKQVESVLTEFSRILLPMLIAREDNILLCYCSCLKRSTFELSESGDCNHLIQWVLISVSL